MQVDPKDLRVSESQYHETLRKWDNGELVMYIDTAALRRFFTDSNIRNASALVGESLTREMVSVRLIMFFLEPVSLLLLSLAFVKLIGWWSIPVISVTVLLWGILKGQTSIGKQRISDAAIGLILASVVALARASEDPWLSLLIFSVFLLYFATKLLYYLSARFGFNLIHRSYIFFSLFYERPGDVSSLRLPMVWTDPPIADFPTASSHDVARFAALANRKPPNHSRPQQKDWIVPPLPPEWRGVTGVQLQRARFHPSTGQEVYILILESPQSGAFPKLSPPSLLRLKTGLGSTSYGSIIFFIWTIERNRSRLAWYEQFLNPQNPGTLKLLTDLAGQQLVKALMVDSVSLSVVDLVEFPNSYINQKLLAAVQSELHKPPGNFELAKQEFESQNSVDDLLAL